MHRLKVIASVEVETAEHEAALERYKHRLKAAALWRLRREFSRMPVRFWPPQGQASVEAGLYLLGLARATAASSHCFVEAETISMRASTSTPSSQGHCFRGAETSLYQGTSRSRTPPQVIASWRLRPFSTASASVSDSRLKSCFRGG